MSQRKGGVQILVTIMPKIYLGRNTDPRPHDKYCFGPLLVAGPEHLRTLGEILDALLAKCDIKSKASCGGKCSTSSFIAGRRDNRIGKRSEIHAALVLSDLKLALACKSS